MSRYLGWLVYRFFIFNLFIGFLPSANAFVMSVTSKGSPVRWKSPVKLNMVGNPTNSSGLSNRTVYQAVVKGLQRWKFASSGSIQFDYWQGTDKSIYLPNSDYNHVSS